MMPKKTVINQMMLKRCNNSKLLSSMAEKSFVNVIP